MRILKKSGFTLVELLVAIAIIGLLAAIVLQSLNSARMKAMIAKSQADLRSLRTSISVLEDDTTKWPNGCMPSMVISGTNNEIVFSIANAGIIARPTVGITDSSTNPPCEWTTKEVAAWKGPYMPVAYDPWGNPYWFDNDYYPKRDCPTPNANSSALAIIAVVSGGPNQVNGAESTNSYDCDDIYLPIN